LKRGESASALAGGQSGVAALKGRGVALVNRSGRGGGGGGRNGMRAASYRRNNYGNKLRRGGSKRRSWAYQASRLALMSTRRKQRLSEQREAITRQRHQK